MSKILVPATLELDLDQLTTLVRATQHLAGHGGDDVALPANWRHVDTQHRVEYRWNDDEVDTFDPFRIYEAEVDGETIRYAIGECERIEVRGRDRRYFIVCQIGPRGGVRAIAEFVETDDHQDSGDFIAVVKGKQGTARLFDPEDQLPVVYATWPTVTYRDRIDFVGSYEKQALVANEADVELMLNHALAQVQLRGL